MRNLGFRGDRRPPGVLRESIRDTYPRDSDGIAAVGDLTDASLVRVLLGVGVSPASAHLAAPGIRLAIDA